KPFKTAALAFILLILLCLLRPDSALAANVISVNKNDSLQEMIDAAEAGSTIVLNEGEYEGPIAINESLNLRAEAGHKVTILNKSNAAAITINAPHVSIENITVKESDSKGEPTIFIQADGVKIERVNILTPNSGIHITNS